MQEARSWLCKDCSWPIASLLSGLRFPSGVHRPPCIPLPPALSTRRVGSSCIRTHPHVPCRCTFRIDKWPPLGFNRQTSMYTPRKRKINLERDRCLTFDLHIGRVLSPVPSGWGRVEEFKQLVNRI